MRAFVNVLGASITVLLLAACDSSSKSLPKLNSVLEFSRRTSLVDEKTAVLILRNKTNQHLSDLKLLLEDQDTLNPKTDTHGNLRLYDRRKEQKLEILAAHATREIGVLETGWLIKANTIVTVSLPGYEDESIYFYNDESGKLQMAMGYGQKKLKQFEEKGKNFIKWLENEIK